ncbi:MAG: TrmH family RNA methyltransferase [Patescibacteria group bacterium]
MIIIAHNIRSLHNVGSIFRNAAAFGIEKLYLTGFTATPPRKEIAKVALGAEELVEWEQGTAYLIIDMLKSKGYKVYGLETGPEAISIDEIDTSGTPVALVLGNEVDGIDKQTRSYLDGLLEIPMQQKRSLNVSVASGVAMYVLRG